MMPNFALHLSFDGITLDQKGPSGWVTLGTAEFTSADLAGDLAALRAAGVAAAGDGTFASKLVLPNDQIKLVTLRDDAPTRTSVGMALEGATPYPLSELEFDWRVKDGQTHIAAVAKETLAEAEAFAQEHNLAPVAFVCLPEDGWDGEEAFFGAVRGVGAVDVRRDPTPYVKSDSLEPVATAAEPVEADSEADEPASEEQETPDSETVAADIPEAPAVEAPEPAAVPKTNGDDAAAAPKLRIDAVTSTAPPPQAKSPALTTALVTEETAPRLLGASAPSAEEISERAPRLAVNPSSDAIASVPPLGSAQASAPAPASEQSIAAASLRPGSAAIADNEGTGGALAGMFRSRRRPANQDRDATDGTETGAPTPTNTTTPKRRTPLTAFDAPAPAGARVGGKPRFLGLILTAILILILLAVAAFATGLSGDRLSRLFSGKDETQEVASLPPGSIALPDGEMVSDGAALDEIIQTPLGDELTEPEGPAVPLISDAELQRTYAATGIWQRAPDAPRPPASANLDDLYVASIDAVIGSQDAVALPPATLGIDTRPASQPLPPAFGETFDVDTRGLVIATPDGTVTPGGYTVIAGRPALVPPLRVPSVETQTTEAEDSRLASFRPRARPDGLAEAQERFDLGGFSRSELASFRPRLRPEAAKQAAEAKAAAEEEAAIAAALAAAEAANTEPEAIVASKFAVATSARPEARPRNFDKIVANARKSQPGTVQKVAAVAPRTTRPSGPTRASVARAATSDNAINLRRVNLIGVYGKPSNRQALVRLANGRFVKVKVGDRVDGGRVAAIGESQIRYVKGGRNITLDIPS
ncbi:hypothetical protein [Shimia ponticola]|uniref:hypothetical protein n=1 Tax=Shimia ponticola TaxID=2582893 RepID=UPI0011BDB853|nr:hypothetical protein [Shimia ponticola]